MFTTPTAADRKRFIQIALVIFAADFATKRIMLASIFEPPRRIELLPILNFSPAWNEGVSFGLLASGGQWTRYGISLLAVLVVVWLFFQLPSLLKWQKIGAAFIAGGAIGNAVDRQIYGRVVDFIDFHLGTWHYPTFNIADAAIFSGVVLWLIAMIKPASTNKNKGNP